MQSKKKLLFFTPALAPYRVDQFNKLNELFELKVVFLDDNVPNQRFDQQTLLGKLECEYAFLLHGFKVNGRYLRKGVRRTIRQFAPDFVMGYEYSPLTIQLILLSMTKQLECELVTMVDDNLEICRNPQSLIRKRFRNWCLKYLDFLVVLSPEVADWYTGELSVAPEKVIVSPIVRDENKFIADLEVFQKSGKEYAQQFRLDGREVILFVGRLAPEKGLDLLFHIIPDLVQMNPDLLFILVGDGPELGKLQQLAKDKNITRHVLMPGRFENERLYAWYSLAHVFVLPSLFEPFGAVVNEALIMGNWVVCSSHAGAASLIIEEKNGYVATPEDAETFKRQILKALKNALQEKGLQLNGRRNLMPQTFDSYFQDWNKMMAGVQ